MFEDQKRRLAERRVRPGDGRALKLYRWWQIFTGRKLFYLQVDRQDGSQLQYAVDVHLNGKQAGDFGGKAHLYLNGRHHAESRLPAAIPVEGGTVEVALSSVGLKRAHYVTEDGVAHQLTPDPKTPIARRLRFERRHPSTSRLIGAVSVVALVVGVVLTLLQIAEPILQVPPIVEEYGRFESPISLPVWANVALGVGAAMGASERALRLRYHWLLDGVGT
jgi:hypothetical protein